MSFEARELCLFYYNHLILSANASNKILNICKILGVKAVELDGLVKGIDALK